MKSFLTQTKWLVLLLASSVTLVAQPAPAPPRPGPDGRLKMIETVEKSERAGDVIKRFKEATSANARINEVNNAESLAARIRAYHAKGKNKDFKITGARILGPLAQNSDPAKLIFPYILTTDKNPDGFVVRVVEKGGTPKLVWEDFEIGQDYPFAEFVNSKTNTTRTFLLVVHMAHSFDNTLTQKQRDGLHALSVRVPPPGFKEWPLLYVDKSSKVGKKVDENMNWQRGRLCRVTIVKSKTAPMMKIVSFDPIGR